MINQRVSNTSFIKHKLALQPIKLLAFTNTGSSNKPSFKRINYSKSKPLFKQDPLLFVRNGEYDEKPHKVCLEQRIEKRLKRLKRLNKDSDNSGNEVLQTSSDSSDDEDLADYFAVREKRLIKLYDVQDIQKELEELTEDENEITAARTPEREQIMVKRKIKMMFKRNLCAPEPEASFYIIGRVLGKGGYGKVNLAMQKLSRKICAVKSINKVFVQTETDMERITNEIFMVNTARLRHPNIV